MSGFSVHIPFVEHLGFELVAFGDGLAEIDFAAKPEHTNSFDVVHGGATMTLLDVVMAHAARAGNAQDDMGVVTIDLSTKFMQASRGKLHAKGRLISRTATMAFTEGHVYDESGKLCSHGTATFKYVKRLPNRKSPSTD